MKKEYTAPQIKNYEFVINTPYCAGDTVSGVTSNPQDSSDKDSMNGWKPWQ